MAEQENKTVNKQQVLHDLLKFGKKNGKITMKVGDVTYKTTKLATAKDYKRVERYLTPVEAAIDAYAGSFPDSLRVERH